METMSYGMIVLTTRRFNDPAGLGYEGYWALIALAVLAWYEGRGKRGDVRRTVYSVMVGPAWYKRRVADGIVSFFHVLDYLEFMCADSWKPGGWRACLKDWRVTEKGYEWLKGKLANLGLALEDVLGQPSPPDVKNLIDNRIKQIYKEHWARIRRYEEATGHAR
jgi:hypothetical protein